jgi:catechol 2,3-dioxygenase
VPRLGRLEHVELGVADADRAVDFYTRVLGLREIAREGDTVYLGCGRDENYDLAVVEDRPGLRHFAVRVEDAAAVEHYQRRLEDGGVRCERRDGSEPGQLTGVRFALPGATQMELVCVRDRRYHRPTRPALAGAVTHAPLDVDHVNILSLDVEKDAAFLRDLLDFRLSDVKKSPDGFWIQAFTRLGDQHHDVAVTMATTHVQHLHHVAWTVTGIEHMKVLIDRIAEDDVDLELGPGRHFTGSSIFSYFWEPGGNRFELSAEVATVDPSADTVYTDGTVSDISAWGPLFVPPSFRKGT